MQMVYAIMQDDDVQRTSEALIHEGFFITKLCSTGGFLRRGNTTLLIGVEKERTAEVLEIIRKGTKKRLMPVMDPFAVNSHFPVMTPDAMVEVGGATVFVVNVSHFEKY